MHVYTYEYNVTIILAAFHVAHLVYGPVTPVPTTLMKTPLRP